MHLASAGSCVKLVEQVGRKGNLDSADHLGILRLADGHALNIWRGRVQARFDFRALPDSCPLEPIWDRVNGARAIFEIQYHFRMTTGPAPIGSTSHLDTDEQEWLHARLAEYQELLAYLRDR
jgi:hypothetical protein